MSKIEEIRAALEGATPGPWKKFSDEVTGVKASDGRIAVCTQIKLLKRRHPTEAPADARLIALAPDMARIVLAAEMVEKAGEALGWWMSAALDDPNVSNEMKTTIYDWLSTRSTYRAAVEGKA